MSLDLWRRREYRDAALSSALTGGDHVTVPCYKTLQSLSLSLSLSQTHTQTTIGSKLVIFSVVVFRHLYLI